MTLQMIVAEFEGRFDRISVETDAAKSHEGVPYVYSGGESSSESSVPALFNSEALALKYWQETVQFKTGQALLWIDRPELVKFQITMMNPKQMHRLASDRWTVRARFIIDGGQNG